MTSAQERVEVLCVDMNGIARGKWETSDALKRVLNGETRLPLSTLILDIWGRGNDEVTGLGQSAGDPDGLCMPDHRTLKPLPWAKGQQIITTLCELDGRPSDMDPRAILSRVIADYARRGWTPVVACELEFYLVDENARDTLQVAPPKDLRMGAAQVRSQLYWMDAMHGMADVLQTIRSYARVQDIPVDSFLAEIGPGQFEVNLLHKPDALAAADDAFCLKRLISHAAAQHGLLATFMAKPYGAHAGSGMHLHVSVIDEHGNNVLDSKREDGLLEAAVAGVVNHMLEAQAIFAPHANSYRRYLPNNFVPIECNWGRDNRAAAVRVPDWEGPNTRLECRMPGADVNPYLVAAVILGCMFRGMSRGAVAPPAMEDDAYDHDATPSLTHDWFTAVERFATSAAMADIFGQKYRDLYAAIKHHEAMTLHARVPDVDLQTYLGRI